MTLSKWLSFLEGTITVHKYCEKTVIWQTKNDHFDAENDPLIQKWKNETVFAVDSIGHNYDLYLTEGEWNE